MAEAKSEWMQLGEDARAVIYLDAATIARQAGHAKFWSLLSFKAPLPGGPASEKRLFMLDCREKSLTWMQSIYFSEARAEGEVLDVRTDGRNRSAPRRPADLEGLVRAAAPREAQHPELAYLAVLKQMC
ncbi:surface-adhesin E family protein [Noviherbaspirillum humi]|nr:surface-adhesin E family protein [Noviherbaspirillum humi]